MSAEGNDEASAAIKAAVAGLGHDINRVEEITVSVRELDDISLIGDMIVPNVTSYVLRFRASIELPSPGPCGCFVINLDHNDTPSRFTCECGESSGRLSFTPLPDDEGGLT